MKIVMKSNEVPKQFSCIQIVCGDHVMAEMLAGSPNVWPTNYAPKVQEFLGSFEMARHGLNHPFELCLTSGAKLKVGAKKDHFYIYCYSQDGKDGLAAMAELRMLESLRHTRRHFDTLNNLMGRDGTKPWLTAEILYR